VLDRADIERLVATVAGQQHGVISRRQLRAIGLSDPAITRRARVGRLFRVFFGVYGLTPRPTAQGRAMAALLAAGADLHLRDAAPGSLAARDVGRLDPDIRVSHWTVLELHGVTVRREPAVHVTTIGGRPRCRVVGVRGHRLAVLGDSDRCAVAGIPAVSVARSLLEVASSVDVRTRRALLREAQFLRLLRDADLERLARDARGHPGWAALDAADPDLLLTTAAESPLAGDLARFLEHDLGFGPWIQELPITTPSGARYRFDHAFPPLRLAAEADGGGHLGSVTRGDDADRDAETAAMGWFTVRVTARQLRDPARLRRQMHAIRDQRAALLGHPGIAG
jgi:hypothetical protein